MAPLLSNLASRALICSQRCSAPLVVGRCEQTHFLYVEFCVTRLPGVAATSTPGHECALPCFASLRHTELWTTVWCDTPQARLLAVDLQRRCKSITV